MNSVAMPLMEGKKEQEEGMLHVFTFLTITADKTFSLHELLSQIIFKKSLNVRRVRRAKCVKLFIKQF